MCPSKPHKNHAFTLIELLVVISIVTLLVALLLPALASARKAAKSMACLSNMRQVGVAIHAYAADYDGERPAFQRLMFGTMRAYSSFSNHVVEHNYTNYPYGPGLLATSPTDGYDFTGPYLKSPDVLFCPLDEKYRPNRVNGEGWAARSPNASVYANTSYMYFYIPEEKPINSNGDQNSTFTQDQVRHNVSERNNAAVMQDLGHWYKPARSTLPFSHSDGWNTLYNDGHAEFIKRDRILPQASWQDYLDAIDDPS